MFKVSSFASDSDSDSSSSSDDEHTFVGIGDEDVDADHSSEVYYAGSSGVRPDGSEYLRVIPDQYDDKSGNNFMRYALTEYAIEEKDTKGDPNGTFKFNKKYT